VLSAPLERRAEAELSAAAFLTGAVRSEVEIGQFPDGYFPYQGSEIKSWMQELARRVRPDVIFTNRCDDGHQDHREIARLTWNCFRDSLIFEYEIPKWDGDLGQPNMYSSISADILDRKVDLLVTGFGTQRSKDWFDPDVFRGLARLRGMECRAPERYAEAFFSRKIMID
jgi:LmbE family N-acetylglucosaminyl deacetylase